MTTEKYRLRAILVLAVFLVLPSLVWDLIDRSVWIYDKSWYATSTLYLAETFAQGFRSWVHEMLHCLWGLKAPGLVWMGQFFLPFRIVTGGFESAMLLCTVFCQTLTLIFIGLATQAILPEASLSTASIAMIFVAAAPLFIGLSHQYLVEPVQTLAVSLFIWIASQASREDRSVLLLKLIAATTFAMMAKITTPLYCFLPGFFILYFILVNKTPIFGQFRSAPKKHITWAVINALILPPSLLWYEKNFRALWTLSKDSAQGPLSNLYGHRYPILLKLQIWGTIARDSYSLSPFLLLLIILIVLGLLLRLRSKPKGRPMGPQYFILIISFFQIVVFFVSASLQVNEDQRFISALLPYVGLLVAYAFYLIQSQRLSLLAASVFLCQWAFFQLGTFNAVPSDARFHFGEASNYLWWGVLRDPQHSSDLAEIVKITCSENQPARTVVGVLTFYLSPATLAYIATRDHFPRPSPCDYRQINSGETDAQNALKLTQEWPLDYFVSLSEQRMNKVPEIGDKPDVFNLVSRELLHLVENNPSFREVPTPLSRDIRVYQRITK